MQTFISQSLQPGPSVSLKCSAVGNPVPVLSWFIDGVLVSDGGGPASFSSADNLDYLPSRFWREHQHHTRFSIGGASTSLNSGQPASGEILSYLNISEVHGEDSGVYTCVASNIVGIMEHSARVNIFGQIFVKEMSPLILVAGQNVQIPCYYGGFPVDKIVWQKDSRNLVEFAVNGKRDAGKFSIFPNGTLQIIRIATEVDKGRYTCQVSNRKGEVASGHVDVNVMRTWLRKKEKKFWRIFFSGYDMFILLFFMFFFVQALQSFRHLNLTRISKKGRGLLCRAT